MSHQFFRPLNVAVRALPLAALATTLLVGAPAEAATTLAVATSPGPLAITVGAPSTIVVGQTVQVGFSVTNTSTAPIGPFTMGMQVSPNARVSAALGGIHTCTKAGNGFACDFLGALQPGLTQNSWFISITPLSAGTIDIDGFVQPTLGSSAPSNTVHLAVSAVSVPQADLQLTQTASNSQPAAGSPVTYALTVKNVGPDAASAVVLSDAIPADGAPLGALASNGGACTVTGQSVSCSLGDIAAGSSVSVSVSALANTLIGGTQTISGSVASATFDPNLANNSASTSIRIR